MVVNPYITVSPTNFLILDTPRSYLTNPFTDFKILKPSYDLLFGIVHRFYFGSLGALLTKIQQSLQTKIIPFGLYIDRTIICIHHKTLNAQLVSDSFGRQSKIHTLYLSPDSDIPMFHASKCNQFIRGTFPKFRTLEKFCLNNALDFNVLCQMELFHILKQYQARSLTNFQRSQLIFHAQSFCAIECSPLHGLDKI